MSTIPLLAASMAPSWWWFIPIAIVALLLFLAGRLASRARVAGGISDDANQPDLPANRPAQSPDIGPQDRREDLP